MKRADGVGGGVTHGESRYPPCSSQVKPGFHPIRGGARGTGRGTGSGGDDADAAFGEGGQQGGLGVLVGDDDVDLVGRADPGEGALT